MVVVVGLIIAGYFTYPYWGEWFRENVIRDKNVQGPPEDNTGNPLVDNTWVSQLDGAMLTLKSNGDYTLDTPSVDNRKKIYGHYRMTSTRIILVNHPSTNVCVGAEGVYDYTIDGENIHFKIISDPCKSRKKYMTEDWFKL